MPSRQLRLPESGGAIGGDLTPGNVLTYNGPNEAPTWEPGGGAVGPPGPPGPAGPAGATGPAGPAGAGVLCTDQLLVQLAPDGLGGMDVALDIEEPVPGAADGDYWAHLYFMVFDSIYNRPFVTEYVGTVTIAAGAIVEQSPPGMWRKNTEDANWQDQIVQDEPLLETTLAGTTWRGLGLAWVCLGDPYENPNEPLPPPG